MVTVREFVDADAPQVAAATMAAVPHLVTSAEALRWELRHAAPARRLRRLVAEVDGRLVGSVRAALLPGVPGASSVALTVAPTASGAGVGGALLATAEEHLAAAGASTVHTWVDDDAHAARFAARRGYRPGRRGHFLHLDLDATPLPPLPVRLPAGVAIRSVAEFGVDLRPLWEADLECADDEPSDVAAGHVAYEPWLTVNWDRPDWDRRLSTVVEVDDEVAAYTVAQTDGVSHCWSAMTGTRRARRGRGLARLAKLHTLHRARAAGVTRCYTGNDVENAPMLAINHALGYRPYRSQRRHLRRLTP